MQIALGHARYANLLSEFPWAKLGQSAPAPPAPADTRLGGYLLLSDSRWIAHNVAAQAPLKGSSV
jgi:hypothetical protein